MSNPANYKRVCWQCYQECSGNSLSAKQLWEKPDGCKNPNRHPLRNRQYTSARLHESRLLLRQFPEGARVTDNFKLCRYNPCPRPKCPFAHNKTELREWNQLQEERLARSNDHRYVSQTQQQSSDKGGSLTKLKHKQNYELLPESELDSDLLTQQLTRENYVDKFHTLLYYEEHEHERVLKERCDKPLNVTLKEKENGCLVGLNSNDVVYAQQAATAVEITVDSTLIAKADITKYGVNNKGKDEVNIKFRDKQQFYRLKTKNDTSPCFPVHFILKHSYFQNMHKSLDRLSRRTIECLIPNNVLGVYQDQFSSIVSKPKLKFLLLDKEYQLPALEKIMACDSSVPFLVTGPFGTGKTRLLATAAYNLLKNPSNRVLICTSHLQSADAYIDSYFGPMKDDSITYSVKRLTKKDYTQYRGNYKHLFTDDIEDAELRNCDLVVTTFLTAPQLIRIEGRPFTHILIDEGAQTREPEVVAPLGLADDNTKIVIAGDHLQIGPQMLVLGEKARTNGLGTSLLQRLHKLYEKILGDSVNNPYTGQLLTNYRCHDSLLRLPSNLFFKSTLQVRSDSKLHPKTVSALEFVCTSVNSTITTSEEDYSENEAKFILEQVRQYVKPWPVAEWEEEDLSTICVMASSRNQVRLMISLLEHDFSDIKGIQIIATYAIQGREFRAIFLSTLEKTELDGSTSNPTKSICDQYVFNTVITRAKSLVVCVGNPFLLFSIETSTKEYEIPCWREYIKRCLETSSLRLLPHCYKADETVVKHHVDQLYSEVFEDIRGVMAPPCCEAHKVRDSILKAYKRAFQNCNNEEILKSLDYVLPNDTAAAAEAPGDVPEAPEDVPTAPGDTPMEGPPIECYLECRTYKKCTAVPLDPKEPPITIQGIDNRRLALDGARVKVRVYKDNSNRFGRVCRREEQGPQRQFLCYVDNYNATFLCPIDHKNPKLANLPRLSSKILKASEFLIQEELKHKHLAVTVFDPKSFEIPIKDDGIPKIKDVIPLSIAERLLFVVWYLKWRPKYRYPLGVVVAAIPKGLTLYHGERLLLAHHHINTTPLDDDEIATIDTAGSFLPYYDHAFTIDPPEAMVLDDALTLEPVASDDGKCYQLGVHITNVGGAVKIGNKVDNGARERGTAVYGSKEFHTIPILPEKVRNTLSLECDKKTTAISYTCEVCIDGEDIKMVPTTIRICESHVRSTARMTYEEVQQSLFKVKGESLHKKIQDYDKALSTNSAFGLEQRLVLLLKISKSLFRSRMQYDKMNYSTENPEACFLVEELMIWANRITAEHIFAAFPQLALLRKLKPPNQDQLKDLLQNYSDIVAHSPVYKTLADNLNITTEPGPVVITEDVRRELYDALKHDKFLQAKNLLKVTNFPQLAVLCKEAYSTKCRAEYVCSSMLQKPFSLENGNYMVSLPQDVSEVYGHNDLCCLYTHSTSPLRRYMDIVVQRLILQSLSTVDGQYSPEELKEISSKCNTTTMNASKFEKEFICLSIALSLAKCSQTCTVHVTRVEKTLNFVIQELDYHCLPVDQCSFHLSSITSNAKPIKPPTEDMQNNCKPEGYEWKAKITSFTNESAVHKGLANLKKCALDSEPNKDAILTFYLFETADRDVTTTTGSVTANDDSHDLALVKHCYMADFHKKATQIGVKDWKKVTDFMKLPSPNTANQLKDLLRSHNPTNEDNAEIPPGASFFLYKAKRSFKVYESFKVSFTASYSDHILSPCIQLLEVAPMLNVCVQHSTKPADCFSSPILSHASKEKYNDIHEYIDLWESVLLAETAVQSVGQAEIQLIQNVPLKWSKLQRPGSSLDDVYYSPFKEGAAKEELADITLTIPAKFEERCGEYFDLRVGNLVCARYNIPLGEEKEVDGRKVTTASAVYHFIIHHIEDQYGSGKSQTMAAVIKQNAKMSVKGSDKVIHLKFASKDTARVSPFMRQYLHSTCEIQVIPLGTPYRRMYKSLHDLQCTENSLCRDIAVGDVTKETPDIPGAVDKFWSGGQLKINSEQSNSVKTAMQKKFQLIQGPPGTGKSVTGAHLAYSLIKSNSNGHHSSPPDGKIRCVMYCGPSNKSLDTVLDMFSKHPNIEHHCVLRIYSKKIETELNSNKEPEYKKAHERYALHKKIRSSECQLSEQIKEMEARFENYEEENKLPSSREKKQLRALIKEAETTVIHKGGYQIVFCTCSEAGSARVVDNIKPTHLIIDEAAMITEPEAMIPIQLADHVTLIGDHQQLQPVINYKHAKERGLGRSLFERYAQSNKDSVCLLKIQYRMHDAICKFPSEQFYDGQLITDQSVSQQFCSLEGFWPNGPNCPIAFCDVEGKEEDGSIDHKVYRESKRNKIEADKTAEIIVALRKKITQNNINNPLRIAVLTPYKAQKKLMEEIVKEKNLNVDSVLTITESQGCEFEFVILSTVRSIPRTKLKNRAAVQPDRTWIGEHLGSLTDRHQICVGITRAKYGLVIVGNAELLKYNETWEKLLKHYEERGCKEEVKDFLTRNNN